MINYDYYQAIMGQEMTNAVMNSVLSFASSFSDISDDLTVLPGFCDVHVHFREPGFSYKETVFSGSRAAARGGYTSVMTMPNLVPVPDSTENLKQQTDIIKRDSVIDIYPYASITVAERGKELSDMDGLADYVLAFSDDGKGVQDADMMEEAMLKAKKLGKVIAAHCEDNSLLFGGCIHDGLYAKEHNHIGISSESEYRMIERDVRLAEKTGCKYHVCHISTKESVEIIRAAKKRGVDVTCETAPHYLVLDENDLREEGRFKMNPPLRAKEDRLALIEGVLDGTVDMIATDHAPHSADEKSRGLEKSPFGITGIETAFPILYSKLVKTGIVSMARILEMLTTAPKKRFGIPFNNDFSLWLLDEKYKVNSESFLSMGKATPFDGKEVFAKNILTIHNGQKVF